MGLEECRGLGGCKTGGARITRGYDLPSRHVIHTVGPVWNGGKYHEPELLAACYRNSLVLAKEHSLKTIAFPSISTGAYRFSVEQAATIALATVKSFLKDHPGVFEKILFVLFSDRDLKIYTRAHSEIFR